MNFEVLDFGGNPYIGVYSRVTEDVCLLPEFAMSAKKVIEEKLGIEVLLTYIGESSVVGSMCAMSTAGVIVPSMTTPEEIEILEKHKRVCVIDDKLNACGNNILLTEKKALLNP
ncbi:MAG: hypothetical protein ACPL1Y_07025, partial [Thermoplasmata archaeon]